MTITATIPTTFTTDRQDVHDLLMAIATGWIAYCQTNFTGLTPGIVRAARHTMPEDLSGEGPLVFIGEIHERITHDMQTRETVFEGDLAYADTLGEPEETDARVNAYADYMRDTFTANVDAIEKSTGRSGMFEQYEAMDVPPLHEGPYPFGHFLIRWRYVVQGGYR